MVELWRYPVKGLLGERLPALELDVHGVVGDRRFAVRGADGKLGSAKTTRRFRRMPHLLSMRSRTTDEGSVVIDVGDGVGRDAGADETAAVVAGVVGQDVRLVEGTGTSHLDDSPVHVLTTASLAWLQARLPHVAVDRRRFRPNLVLDCPGARRVEEQWLDQDLVIGGVRLRVERRVVRCVTIALAQEELGSAPDILRELERANDLSLGVYASVVEPGRVEEGAVARVEG